MKRFFRGGFLARDSFSLIDIELIRLYLHILPTLIVYDLKEMHISSMLFDSSSWNGNTLLFSWGITIILIHLIVNIHSMYITCWGFFFFCQKKGGTSNYLISWKYSGTAPVIILHHLDYGCSSQMHIANSKPSARPSLPNWPGGIKLPSTWSLLVMKMFSRCFWRIYDFWD